MLTEQDFCLKEYKKNSLFIFNLGSKRNFGIAELQTKCIYKATEPS